MNIHLNVITDGRRDCVERTLESAAASLHGPISSRVIVDDSADPAYKAWLDDRYSADYRIFHSTNRLGFAGAIQAAWALTPRDAEFVFGLEDDFVFLEQVDLLAMAATLRRHPHLRQLVLKRQPWSDDEKRAGDIIGVWPDEYHDQCDLELATMWTEHRLYWSTNPHLTRREVLDLGWPGGPGSEKTFTEQLLSDPDTRFAFWGPKDAPPKVMHIGEQRVGGGY